MKWLESLNQRVSSGWQGWRALFTDAINRLEPWVNSNNEANLQQSIARPSSWSSTTIDLARITANARKISSDENDDIQLFRVLSPGFGTLCSSCQQIKLCRSNVRYFELGTVLRVSNRSRQGCTLCTLVATSLQLDPMNVGIDAKDDILFLYGVAIGDLECIQTRDRTVIREANLKISKPQSGQERRARNPDSPETFHAIKAWLSKCINEHDCGANDNVALPTRLVDVAQPDPNYIRLISTATELIQDPRYVALSYCWGRSTPFITNTSNIHQHLQGFPLRKMPKTLRDAVQVTRGLGCRYLWIDALCIIQGSDTEALADWEYESGQMEQVYGNAYVTIAASASSDCNGGIFYTRWPPCHLPPPEDEKDDRQDSNASKTSMEVIFSREFKDEPLNSRAWALQERLLSTRIITYSTNDVIMQCNKSLIRESGIEVGRSWHRIYRYRFPVTAPPTENEWYLIVENYCSRNLTNPEDKLPAMAGMARHFNILTQGSRGRYLAGIWEKGLIPGILWCRHESITIMFAPLPQTGRPTKYRAPSWSWASSDRAVSHIHARPVLLSQVVSKIIRCSTSTVSSNPFGMVDSGQLTIRGPVRKGPSNRLSTDFGRSIWFDDDDDIAEQKLKSTALYCGLLIAGRPTDDYAEKYGLILMPVSGDSTCYIRIGIFRQYGVSWKDAVEETLTII